MWLNFKNYISDVRTSVCVWGLIYFRTFWVTDSTAKKVSNVHTTKGTSVFPLVINVFSPEAEYI